MLYITSPGFIYLLLFYNCKFVPFDHLNSQFLKEKDNMCSMLEPSEALGNAAGGIIKCGIYTKALQIQEMMAQFNPVNMI